MTGEVTLRGHVLPIGGLKEKLLAAKRGRIKTVLIPSKNEKDLTEIPDEIKNQLDIISTDMVDKVLENALEHLPIPVSDPNEEEITLDENSDLEPVLTKQKTNLGKEPFEVPNFPQH